MCDEFLLVKGESELEDASGKIQTHIVFTIPVTVC